MPEMPLTGEDHGEAQRIRRFDHRIVAHRTARLDHGAGARLGQRLHPVREGKESVRGDDGALGQGCGEAKLTRLVQGLSSAATY